MICEKSVTICNSIPAQASREGSGTNPIASIFPPSICPSSQSVRDIQSLLVPSLPNHREVVIGQHRQAVVSGLDKSPSVFLYSTLSAPHVWRDPPTHSANRRKPGRLPIWFYSTPPRIRNKPLYATSSPFSCVGSAHVQAT